MDLDKIKTLEDLKNFKAKFYSKDGILKKLQEKIRVVAKEKRSQIGKEITKIKHEAEAFFEKAKLKIANTKIEDKLKNEWVDVTEPINSSSSLHPLSLVEERFRTWLISNGYFETSDSEIVSDEYNFERLNIPKEHPARDMQDTLYLSNKTLLRTHNTGISAYELEKNKNKAFAHFAIGTVYRKDEDDATHSHQFMQIDLVAVGNITFSNLVYTLKSMLSYVFETEIKLRLRQSYFPFTEPSVEVDIFYKNKWIEVLGAGLLHPNVMKRAGYTNDMNGLAAGIGIERIAMIKYGISDIREFYKNDLRFLNQFKGGK